MHLLSSLLSSFGHETRICAQIASKSPEKPSIRGTRYKLNRRRFTLNHAVSAAVVANQGLALEQEAPRFESGRPDRLRLDRPVPGERRFDMKPASVTSSTDLV